MTLTAKQLKQLRGAPVGASGNRLHLACEISESVQAEISRATGLSPQYINDVARGRYQTVTVDNAHKFAEYFGCAIEDLFPAREQVA